MYGKNSAQEIELLMMVTNPIHGAASEQLASIAGHLLWPLTRQKEETTFHARKEPGHDLKCSGV